MKLFTLRSVLLLIFAGSSIGSAQDLSKPNSPLIKVVIDAGSVLDTDDQMSDRSIALFWEVPGLNPIDIEEGAYGAQIKIKDASTGTELFDYSINPEYKAEEDRASRVGSIKVFNLKGDNGERLFSIGGAYRVSVIAYDTLGNKSDPTFHDFFWKPLEKVKCVNKSFPEFSAERITAYDPTLKNEIKSVYISWDNFDDVCIDGAPAKKYVLCQRDGSSWIKIDGPTERKFFSQTNIPDSPVTYRVVAWGEEVPASPCAP